MDAERIELKTYDVETLYGDMTVYAKDKQDAECRVKEILIDAGVSPITINVYKNWTVFFNKIRHKQSKYEE